MLGTLLKCFSVLPIRDQLRVRLIIVAQLLLSLLDLVAVAIFGALGSIAVKGVQSRDASTFIDPIINQLGIGNLSFQNKVAFLALSASFILITKTSLTALITKRSLHFLSRKGSELSSKLIEFSLVTNRGKSESLASQDLLYALTHGANNVTLGVLGTFIALASDFSLLVIMGVALFFVDFVTAVSTMVFFVMIGLILYFSLHKKSSHLGRLQAELSIDSNKKILTVYKAYPEIFVRNTASKYLTEISRKRNELASVSAETAFLPYVGKFVIETAIVIGVILLSLVQFANQDAAGASGTLAFFVASATRIAPAILRIQHGAVTINYSANSSLQTLSLIELMKSFTADTNETQSASNIESLEQKSYPFEARIEFKDVEYIYPNANKPALKDISFKLQPGEFLAIVGPSGSGKTTLIELVLGIREPSKGIAEISGEPAISIHSNWPGKIAYVPQEVFILEGTLRENLLMGLATVDFPDSRLLDVLRLVKLEEFMSASKVTLDSLLGEEGSNLSGGQKQRIGIARALLSKPELLILDEATSALDGITELEISKTLSEMQSVSSLIVIAHRLSTIRSANRLIYLENGSIKFDGSIIEARKSIPDFDKQAEIMGLN